MHGPLATPFTTRISLQCLLFVSNPIGNFLLMRWPRTGIILETTQGYNTIDFQNCPNGRTNRYPSWSLKTTLLTLSSTVVIERVLYDFLLFYIYVLVQSLRGLYARTSRLSPILSRLRSLPVNPITAVIATERLHWTMVENTTLVIYHCPLQACLPSSLTITLLPTKELFPPGTNLHPTEYSSQSA